MKKKMTFGESKPTPLVVGSIIDLHTPPEKINVSHILEIKNGQPNFLETDFQNIEPEIGLSQINQLLNFLDNTGWSFVLTKAIVDDENNALRITLLPPENCKIDLLGSENSDEKKIVLIKKEDIWN